MQKSFFLYILIVISLPIVAASNITGKVVNSLTQVPIEFVNVTLYQPNDKVPLKNAKSNADGDFALTDIADGKYVVKVKYIGYKTNTMNITVNGKQVKLGLVKMEEKTERLSEVEVIGQGSQMHFDIDKKVFSVDKNIASSGGSITDVLKNIPSVDVDVEGNVSLRNDNNVEVWINGKSAGLTSANRAQILEQMPAEDVKSIEIITNPSAKYSASGTAGIINLVMKENRKPGYYGGVSAGLTRASGGKIGGLLGANISYANKKFDVYGNMGYRDVVKQGIGWTDRYRYDGSDTTKLRKDNSKFHQTRSFFLRTGFDFHLDNKNVVGFSGFGLLSRESSDNMINYQKMLIPDNYVYKKYSRENIQKGDHPSLHLSLDYRHEFDKKGSALVTSITYSRHQKGGNHEFIQQDSMPKLSYSDIEQNSVNISTHLEFKADYTKQFSKISKLEAGWHSKLLNQNDNSYGINMLNGDSIPSFYDKFNYKEQIHAGYVTYSNRFKRFGFLAGLRGEYITYNYTNSTSTISDPAKGNSYFQLFPSMFLSYSLPGKNELQLNYTRRINRPGGSDINPFHDYSDANDINYGNPDLIPEYSASMELNYIKNWNNHTLSASVYYKSIDNNIEDVSFVSPTNSDVMENTFMNVSRSQKAGVELIAKDNLFRFLDLTSSLNLYYNKLDSAVYYDAANGIVAAVPGQRNFSWTGKVIANFMFNKGFSGQVIGEYASQKLISQGIKSPNYSIDLGLRKTFFDRNLAVNLTLRDILNSDRKKTTIWGDGFSETSESIPHGRTLRLTVSYNFGNMKAKKRTEMDKKQELPDQELPDQEQNDETE